MFSLFQKRQNSSASTTHSTSLKSEQTKSGPSSCLATSAMASIGVKNGALTPHLSPNDANGAALSRNLGALTAARAINFEDNDQQQQPQPTQSLSQMDMSGTEDPVHSGWDINDQTLPPVCLHFMWSDVCF